MHFIHYPVSAFRQVQLLAFDRRMPENFFPISPHLISLLWVCVCCERVVCTCVCVYFLHFQLSSHLVRELLLREKRFPFTEWGNEGFFQPPNRTEISEQTIEKGL